MIHAYDTSDRARCGAGLRNGAPSVTEALYRDLCRPCITAITESCLRKRRPR